MKRIADKYLMSSKPRYLTKSRFKMAAECPTKLFFTGKKEFGNNNIDNSFLQALAEGGFQVGELAKLYYPGGHEVETLDVAIAISETERLLTQKNVTIYEPAFIYKNLLVRVDVLVKTGNYIELIEVKAKSFDDTIENQFYNKTQLKKGVKQISSEWEPYLCDVAFQKYVLSNSNPTFKVSASLLLADKNSVATVEGLNQLFVIETIGGRTKARSTVDVNEQAALGDKVLVKINVDDEVEVIHNAKYANDLTFEEYLEYLSVAYAQDKFIEPQIGSQCKACEYRIGSEKKTIGLKSGFEVCWKTAAKIPQRDFERPMIFEIWNFRKAKDLIATGRYFIDQVEEDDICPKPCDEPGLSSSERQWLQVQKTSSQEKEPFIDFEGLQDEFSKFRFPLHFIDFETSMVAIPFNKGRRPYEQIAFQFSHHVMTAEGNIFHKDEYLFSKRGQFPNFEFVRALKASLSTDKGTIFRYSAHENTVLCQIYQQLKDSEEHDKKDLMNWIQTVTTSTGDVVNKWDGERTMVDLCELVKSYFYHPEMKGSNSIKKVLPAILQGSTYLQEKYSKKIYGTKIESKNYKDWQWIHFDGSGKVKDPYKLLPPVYEGIDFETLDSMLTENSIADGGAAMTAFARMQFTEMSDDEKNKVISALLKYCELDTFAMVLIFEYWKHELDQAKKKGRAA